MISQTISHYSILNKLGAGGMGEVYLAQDTKLGRKVAIKFLPADSAADPNAKKRLIHEAKAAATLDHPNICAIHEVGEEDGRSFIVMQYVDGETLADHIHRKALDLGELLDLAIQVADALAAAHSRDIIHRDIKPQNIMITARGQAKVMDFGLAKVVTERDVSKSEAETQSLLTEPGMIVGTVPYMSPEQVRGEPIDARSDIFSFGTVVYEMISGRRPFEGESAAATTSAILTRQPLPLARYSREAPAELERIVGKALHKNREERYQTAKDLLIDLKNLRHHLELEAELERSKEPIAVAASGGQAIGETAKRQAALTGEALARPTSSIEYVVTGVLRHKLPFAALALALLALAVIGAFLLTGGGEAIDSVAILPFVNVSADPNTEYLSDGITETLISKLSQLPNLKVMSRNSAFRYKGQEIDPQAVGRDLKVQAVLTGQLVQRGDNLAISLELVDARDSRQLWGEQYNRKLSDILSVQAEISREISDKLRLRLSGAEQKQLTKHNTENTEAYQLYHKGRFYWNKFSENGLKKSIEYFNQAIEADPKYALAYAGLADSYSVQGAFGIATPNEVWPKAKLALEKAVTLDDTLAQVHSSLGAVKVLFEWDWPGAEGEFKRAIQLNPNLADAHDLYCYYFQAVGRLDEATSEIKRAQELDPLSTVFNTDLAFQYYYMHRYDAAIEQYRKANELDPNFLPVLFLPGQAYERKGFYDEAISECQKALSIHGRDPAIVSVLGYVYAVSGKRSEAQKALNELTELWKRHYFPPVDIALIHAGLGDRDQAFAWLDKAYEARDSQLIWVRVEPELEDLHRDPRFADMLRRIGLPQ